MTLKEEYGIIQLMALYFRTYPPYSKNENNIICKIKRRILMIIIRIVTRDDVSRIEEALDRYNQRYYLHLTR